MSRRQPEPPCPNEAEHTSAPDAYLAWHAWAARKSRTHQQQRCDGCGLYKIWIPRRAETT